VGCTRRGTDNRDWSFDAELGWIASKNCDHSSWMALLQCVPTLVTSRLSHSPSTGYPFLASTISRGDDGVRSTEQDAARDGENLYLQLSSMPSGRGSRLDGLQCRIMAILAELGRG
jgi:hypothetical protein